MCSYWLEDFTTFGKVFTNKRISRMTHDELDRKHANYAIIPELKLIIECCKGPTSIEDSMTMKVAEITDPNYNPSYDVIVDLREVEATSDMNPTEQIKFFANYIQPLELDCKVAFLTSKPHQVIISEMLKQLTHSSTNLHIETFSTLTAAIKYLGFADNKLETIARSLEELNKNTVVEKNNDTI